MDHDGIELVYNIMSWIGAASLCCGRDNGSVVTIRAPTPRMYYESSCTVCVRHVIVESGRHRRRSVAPVRRTSVAALALASAVGQRSGLAKHPSSTYTLPVYLHLDRHRTSTNSHATKRRLQCQPNPKPGSPSIHIISPRDCPRNLSSQQVPPPPLPKEFSA